MYSHVSWYFAKSDTVYILSMLVYNNLTKCICSDRYCLTLSTTYNITCRPKSCSWPYMYMHMYMKRMWVSEHFAPDNTKHIEQWSVKGRAWRIEHLASECAEVSECQLVRDIPAAYQTGHVLLQGGSHDEGGVHKWCRDWNAERYAPLSSKLG